MKFYHCFNLFYLNDFLGYRLNNYWNEYGKELLGLNLKYKYDSDSNIINLIEITKYEKSSNKEK